MSIVATHVRIFDPEPSDDLVTKRTAAVKDIASRLKKGRPVEPIFKTAQGLALAALGRSIPDDLKEEIATAIQKQSTAFIADGQDMQVAVVGMLAALRVLNDANPGGGTLTATDVLAIGLWSALAFQSPRSEQRIETLRCEVLEAARSHVLATAVQSRKRMIVPDVGFTAPADLEPVKLSEAFKDGAKATIAALRSNSALDREELDILWWALSDRSELLGSRITAAEPASAAIAAGLEMGRMMRRMPADAHRNLVLRNVIDDGVERSLEELVASVAKTKSALSAPYASNVFVKAAPEVFPLISTLATGAAPMAGGDCKRTLREWAERALLESAMLKVASELPSVGI